CVLVGLVLPCFVACEQTATTKPAAAVTSAKHINPGPPNAPIVVATFGSTYWQPPAEGSIPHDSMGASIRRGLALLRYTSDSLPAFAPGHINCTNCHLQDGRALYAAPLAGSHARFPKYMTRSGAVITLADRVNYCFTRSLAGNRLPTDSREMADILSYIAWLSKDVPIGAKVPGADGLPTMKDSLVPNPARGASLYSAKCQTCHQENGAGTAIFPALWGARSYSVGASMARVERAASFISHNMPYGQGGTLSAQEAFDIAAFVNSHERPDSPGKENDWPLGGVPSDVPYTTRSGHQGVNVPPTLTRKYPARTLVPAPPRAKTQ
ncbi:MAG: c-type cytochrome, partial [Gemmatimonadota bacterium]|nr:c-type cytochrome [Gemmatimonadota bacterium]